jgi:hypothetical protein
VKMSLQAIPPNAEAGWDGLGFPGRVVVAAAFASPRLKSPFEAAHCAAKAVDR